MRLEKEDEHVLFSVSEVTLSDVQKWKRLSPRQSYIKTHPNEDFESKQKPDPFYEVAIQNAKINSISDLGNYLVNGSVNIYASDNLREFERKFGVFYCKSTKYDDTESLSDSDGKEKLQSYEDCPVHYVAKE